MVELVTVKLRRQTVERLNRMKVHPRQPLYEVVDRLLEEVESLRGEGGG